MAHTCPDCGSYCTCSGDWDDIDMGEWIGCKHYLNPDCEGNENNDFEDYTGEDDDYGQHYEELKNNP